MIVTGSTIELTDDIERLKQMLANLQYDNQVLNSEVGSLNSEVDSLNSEVELLNANNKALQNSLNIALEQLKLNRKKEFGSRSEKCLKAH